jgi:hypothetical protein
MFGDRAGDIPGFPGLRRGLATATTWTLTHVDNSTVYPEIDALSQQMDFHHRPGLQPVVFTRKKSAPIGANVAQFNLAQNLPLTRGGSENADLLYGRQLTVGEIFEIDAKVLFFGINSAGPTPFTQPPRGPTLIVG